MTATHSAPATTFRGPFTDGPPPALLLVEETRLDRLGWRELRRACVAPFVLLAFVLTTLARRASLCRRGPWRAAAADGLVEGFIHLGPTFVKLGQMIASSPGVFPPALSQAALRCLDDVPPFDATTVHRIVQSDLGLDVTELFASFEDLPLSAASVGQVHACTLRDGRDAVIKVQRPGIAAVMLTDLRLLHATARGLQRIWPAARRANLVAIIEDLHLVTSSELNPALEAWRQARFREDLHTFGDNATVTAAEIYWDHSGPNTICMERLRGVPLDRALASRPAGIDSELLLRRAVKPWFECITTHGLFHGDLHAGNLWLLDDDRVAVLDFGIMGELDETWMSLFRELFRATMITGDFTPVAAGFRAASPAFVEAVAADADLGGQLATLFTPLLDSGVSDLSIGEVLRTVADAMETLGGPTPRELVLVAKQLLYLERYAKELAPGWAVARDLYLMTNVLPEARSVAADRNVELPI